MVAAGHPVPDQGQPRQCSAGIELARSSTAVISSSFCSRAAARPLGRAGGSLTLAEKEAVHQALLRSGAPIGQMNIVRKRLSRIKGGRLALAAAPARCFDPRDLGCAGRRASRHRLRSDRGRSLHNGAGPCHRRALWARPAAGSAR